MAHPPAALDHRFGRLHEIAVQDIGTNPDQPRKHFDEVALSSLVDSIRERGVLQPIIVSPAPGERP